MENNSTEHTREALVKDISNLKRDAARLTDDVKHHAEAHVTAAREHVQRKVKSLQEEVAARPFTVLGVGFLLGFLFALRFRR